MEAEGCLLHSHGWVRLLSAQLVGLHLSQVSPESLAGQMGAVTDHWISEVATVRALVLDSRLP